MRISVTRETGDIAFQAATVPGRYEVYYLPYNPPAGNFDDAGTYFAPADSADGAWRQRNRLRPEELSSGCWRELPQARVLRIEARGERHRMDPMEVIATGEEVTRLLAAHPRASYLLFPEDRANAIRMFEAVPLKWIASGPGDVFRGGAQPGEFYPFQIGVWAARSAIASLALEWSELRNDRGDAIPASALTCFNLSGNDWLGRPLRPTFAIPQGGVRALWLGVQISTIARGTYRGSVVVKPAGALASTVRLEINVSGPVLADGGVSELWRLARLKWLNSTLGLDDEVVPPYTPLEVEGNTVHCLGRAVRFAASGLPESVVSKGREIFRSPIVLMIETHAGASVFRPASTHLSKVTPGTVERVTFSEANRAAVTTRARMEFDGCLHFSATLKAKAELSLNDVRLEIPLKREVATYLMGMKKRGGYRPKEWRWKWDVNRADNQVWIGDPDGGLQLTLPGAKDAWNTVTLRDAGLPLSWWNHGKGGCEIRELGDTVLIRVHSGPRAMRAGEELEFRFRLLITPFKPTDREHWNWRYGDVRADGNILHVHHGAPPNSFINYPFLESDALAELVRSTKAIVKRTDPGELTYPAAGSLNPLRGALNVWTRVNFDPKAGQAHDASFNHSLVSLDFPNDDSVGFYWNIDVRGMRAYVRNGPPEKNVYSAMIDAPAPEWKPGDRHVLTLSWGEQLAIFIDGRLRTSVPYRGLTSAAITGAKLVFGGEGFILDAVEVTDQPFAGGRAPALAADEHTLLLDTFNHVEGTTTTRPEKSAGGVVGRLHGTVRWNPSESGPGLHLTSRVLERQNGVNLYYTVRELSDHVAEMWPLRSLGGEVFQQRETLVAYAVDKTTFGQAGGGYPWLREHLVAGYVPGWRQPLPGGETDAAIATQGLSRWHNYYLEGLAWLMERVGIDGLYLDGIGYDREIMKRVAKVMRRVNPRSRINFHCGNEFDFMNWQTSPANTSMEHLPFVSNLWFGEMYDYNREPDYWLVEISGIPFGLTGEMLNYENGGNPYRGMIYGMTGRQHPSAPAMWRFWYAFGIQDAEMLGYWNPRCPVRTGRSDVLATAYVRKDRTLIALASWAKDAVRCRLEIEWQRLNLDPKRVRLRAPAIDYFQASQQFSTGEEINVASGKGWLLIVEPR